MSILVSVNCITYNHENYIADAIESFLMQITDFDYEILIGEDCSTDRTRRIVDDYAKKYPDKIRIITSEKNVGGRENSRRVLEASVGKYIAECEGDDYWTDPYKLQRQVDYMESHPDCSVCFHASGIVLAPNKQTAMKIKPYNVDQVSPIEDMISGGGGFCHTGALFYPKKCLEHPPDFYLSAHVGDYPVQLILASQGHAYYMAKQMSVYRMGVEGSWSSQKRQGENSREKMIRINDGDIAILKEFNQFTRFKYKETIEKTILIKELETQLLQGNKMVLKNSRFKECQKQLTIKQKLKLYIKCNYPYFFASLSRWRPKLYRVLLFIKPGKRHINATR